MTGNNPPHDGNANETAQWWSTPTPPGDGASLTGVDPTMIAGASTPGFQAAAPPPAPAFPAQPSQPGYPAQSQPAYPQQPAPGYPPQDAFTGQQPYPQQQPTYPPQPAYPPQPGFPPQAGYPPYPPKKKSSKGWIVGVVVLVVVVAVIGGVVALVGKTKHSIASKLDGKYSMSKVSDGCAVVDPTLLQRWATTPDGTPTHTEQKASDFTGGSATCDLRFTKPAGSYQTDTAGLNMELNFSDAMGTPSYDIWKKVDMATTGSGYSSGDLSGVGSDAYWQVKEDTSSYSTYADYTCATKDSNVSVQIHLNLDLSSGYSRSDAQNVCTSELTHVLTSVKK